MGLGKVSAVLFVRDLKKVAAFYSDALGMTSVSSDDAHVLLKYEGFELIVHQIPKHIASDTPITQPPERRESNPVRLDYTVQNLEQSQRIARTLGGDIDDVPPRWADRSARFFLGYDPEGNIFGVRWNPADSA